MDDEHQSAELPDETATRLLGIALEARDLPGEFARLMALPTRALQNEVRRGLQARALSPDHAASLLDEPSAHVEAWLAAEAELPPVARRSLAALCLLLSPETGGSASGQVLAEAIRLARSGGPPGDGASDAGLPESQAATARHAPAPGPAPDPLIGGVLGEFEIVELLGRGGMGLVYKARQPSLGRFVAIKVLPPSLAADESFIERFSREARAAAAINHPNIIEVYDVGEDRGHQYIAMEFVAGETLADILKREGRLNPTRAIQIVRAVASALADAHECGILHRDVKPSNILIDRKGRVKVADFGLAKHEGVDVSVTATGQALGTPLYMPPEAARGDMLDARADLYSLGATFYHVLAGRPPFEGETAAHLIVMHMEAPVPSLQDAAPDCPAALCGVVHRLLSKSPAERYESTEKLLEVLARIETGLLAEESTPTQSVTAATGAARHAARRRDGAPAHKRPIALIAGGIAVVVVLVAVLALVFRPKGGRPSAVALPGTRTPSTAHRPLSTKPEPPPDDERWTAWEDLFDGKTLKGWKIAERFCAAGQTLKCGQAQVSEGQIILESGPRTMITRTDGLPAGSYELVVEAKRVVGQLDFCSMFIPIGKQVCCLTVGGLSGAEDRPPGTFVGLGEVVGHGGDADGATSRFSFETGRWYQVRLRVTAARIQVWIDQERVIDLARAGRDFRIWHGVAEPREPLLIYSAGTKAALRSIRLRRLKPDAKPEAKAVPWKVYTQWPFDAAEAKRRQEETAKALGVPVEQVIDLGSGVKMALVLIPAGEFLMGTAGTLSPAELAEAFGDKLGEFHREFPQHRVTITRPFWLGKTEVTQAQWQVVAGKDPSGFSRRPQNPVEQVSWDDCQSFLQELSAKQSKTFRLPTEAEWEYACRAGTSTEFYFGDNQADLPRHAWFSTNSGGSTHTVAEADSNPWGLHDMLGNVWEWCEDWFGRYGEAPQVDPAGPGPSPGRVLRGGSWTGLPAVCRSASRGIRAQDEAVSGLGFRVCLTAGSTDATSQP